MIMTKSMAEHSSRKQEDGRKLPLVERAARILDVPESTEDSPPTAGLDQVETAPSAPPPEREATSEQHQRRTSRFEQIDFARLQKLGFMAPGVSRSRTKEEFRIIKRSILQNSSSPQKDSKSPPNLVMVTSSRPNEGKTFTAINLAISIALEQDYTVLLVDADFSKPSIPETLGIKAEAGLIDVLENSTVDLADVLIRTSVDKLTVLPAGHAHDLGTELLGSQRIKNIMAEIARRYRDRIVIFDAPPILSTSEPSALAAHVGQVVFVIEAEKTSKSVVQEALSMINSGPRVGVVLNRCRPQAGHAQFGSYYKR